MGDVWVYMVLMGDEQFISNGGYKRGKDEGEEMAKNGNR